MKLKNKTMNKKHSIQGTELEESEGTLGTITVTSHLTVMMLRKLFNKIRQPAKCFKKRERVEIVSSTDQHQMDKLQI